MKILIIITTGFVPWGGLTTVAMNYYRAMNKEGLKIDFASYNNPPTKLVKEVEKNGGNYFQLPKRKKTIIKYMCSLYKILEKEKYDVVHIHGNSATMTFELVPAWMAGVKKRIVHVHAMGNQHELLDKTLRPVFNKLLTERLAVSVESGNYMYGKKDYIILNNAIDIEHYRFQKNLREKCRRKYGIPMSAYVVGNVGKLNKGKNQKFIIDIFNIFLKNNPESFLLIVGGGELEEKLKMHIKSLNIEKNCVLAGMQNDTTMFLSAMDVFLFPSLYEGLGMAAVEAQASGLPVVASTNVPILAGCTDLFEQIDLKQGENAWANRIVEIKNLYNDRQKNKLSQIRLNGFDIRNECIKLENLYGAKNG